MASTPWLQLLLVSVVLCSAAADFAMEGESYSLKCESEDPVQYWMLHGRGQAYKPDTNYAELLIQVDSDGVLQFTEVKKEHEGNHLCVTTVSGETRGVSVAMEVRPKPSQNLWEDMYKAQFITGLISALVCAFLFTAGCLVFRFRYREPKAVLLNDSEEKGHHNPALDIESDYNTKM